MLAQDLLIAAAADAPNKVALRAGARDLTFGELDRDSDALAASLQALGVVRGDRVATLTENSAEMAVMLWAAWKAGAVFTPFNHAIKSQTLGAVLRDAEPKVLLVQPQFAQRVEEAMAGGARPALIWTKPHEDGVAITDLIAGGGAPADPGAIDEDLALLIYTSGSTGAPKGVMLTQENVTFHALFSIPEFELTDADTWAHIGPMFHLVDAWAVFACTWVGARHVFAPYFKADAVLDLFEKEQVTKTALVPTMLNALINDPSVTKRSFPHLQVLTTAGSPVAPEIVKKTCDTFGCKYWQFYGMTECSPLLTISKPMAHMKDWDAERLLAITSRTGRTVLGVELKVVKDDGREVRHDDADVGEIVVRGPSITPGYWKQKDATDATIVDGWLHTGDLAVVDSEGYVNVVDRKKDMIITGGENVYSTEVEYALYEHPDVVECAVFGIPDKEWGEKVKAVIVKRVGAAVTEADIIAFVRNRLAAYKAPRSVEFIDALPKTGSGKIYKKGLRDDYWKSEAKPIN